MSSPANLDPSRPFSFTSHLPLPLVRQPPLATSGVVSHVPEEEMPTRGRRYSLPPLPLLQASAERTSETAEPILSPAVVEKRSSSTLSRVFTLFSRGSRTRSSASKSSKKVLPQNIAPEIQAKMEENLYERTFSEVIRDKRAQGRSELEIARSLLSDIENTLQDDYTDKEGATKKEFAAEILHQILSAIPFPSPPIPTAQKEWRDILGVAMQNMVHRKNIGGNREKWTEALNTCCGISVSSKPAGMGKELLVSASKIMPDGTSYPIALTEESKKLLQIGNAKFDSSLEQNNTVYKNYFRHVDENVLSMVVSNKPIVDKNAFREESQLAGKPYSEQARKAEVERQHKIELTTIRNIVQDSVFAPSAPQSYDLYKKEMLDKQKEAVPRDVTSDAFNLAQKEKVSGKLKVWLASQETGGLVHQTLQDQVAKYNTSHPDDPIKDPPVFDVNDVAIQDFSNEQLFSLVLPRSDQVLSKPASSVANTRHENVNKLLNQAFFNVFLDNVAPMKGVSKSSKAGDPATEGHIDQAMLILDQGIEIPSQREAIIESFTTMMVDFGKRYTPGQNAQADHCAKAINKFIEDHHLMEDENFKKNVLNKTEEKGLNFFALDLVGMELLDPSVHPSFANMVMQFGKKYESGTHPASDHLAEKVQQFLIDHDLASNQAFVQDFLKSVHQEGIHLVNALPEEGSAYLSPITYQAWVSHQLSLLNGNPDKTFIDEAFNLLSAFKEGEELPEYALGLVTTLLLEFVKNYSDYAEDDMEKNYIESFRELTSKHHLLSDENFINAFYGAVSKEVAQSPPELRQRLPNQCIAVLSNEHSPEEIDDFLKIGKPIKPKRDRA